MSQEEQFIQVGLAQHKPNFLQKESGLRKVQEIIQEAANNKCDLLVFGEAFLPGYPFWLSFANGSKFESEIQKSIHARYLKEAVCIENGDLDSICNSAREANMAVYLGIVERPKDRGGHSLYCSLVYINKSGKICSVHRKLQPTYEERLCWAPGDGQGLQVHDLPPFSVGGLNCWENWMPLSRTALYGKGENLHVAVWPGSLKNTKDITRFIALESRSYVLSVSSIMTKADIPSSFPHYDDIIHLAPEVLANGGSCIANPDGSWLQAPIVDEEQLIVATLDIEKVYQERQNFDVAGHYSRPDVTKLILNQDRQRLVDE